LNMDLDVECDIESKSVKGKAIERKQLAEVLNIIASNQMFTQSPTLLDQILSDYDIRNRDKIIAEVMQASQAQAEAAKPIATPSEPKGPSISLSFKGELLPKAAQDAILDKVLGMDVPMDTPSPSPLSPQPGVVPPAPGPFSTSKGVGTGTEGLEGMDVGNGSMSTGGMV
jgi:hypothetical protein